MSERSPPGPPRLDGRFTFNNFISSPQNEFAYAVAERVAGWDEDHLNPVVFFGPYGFGKTHLLQAVARAAVEARPTANVILLGADQLLGVLHRGDPEEVAHAARRLEAADLVLIDDAQLLAQRAPTQSEAVALLRRARRVVVTSDRAPAEMPAEQGDLRDYLAGGLVCAVGAPDAEHRRQILKRKLVDLAGRGGFPAKIKPEVIEYLIETFTDSVRELEGALNVLVARVGVQIADVTVEDAKVILRPHVASTTPRVTVDMVQKVVAEHYKLKQIDLISERRARSVALPRQIGMWLAKQVTTRTLPDIGRRFGGRDHTTVLHAVRRIESMREESAEVRKATDILLKQLRGLNAPVEGSSFSEPAAARAAAELVEFDPEKLPRQSRRGARFKTSGTGPISLAPDKPVSNSELEDGHALVLKKCERLEGACSKGQNRTAALKQGVEDLREALGDGPSAMRVRFLWAYGNTLRRMLDADLRARRSPDPETPPLPELAGELLADLVQEYNVFVFSHPVLLDLDRQSLGPADRAQVLVELEAGRALTEAVKTESCIMDPEATRLLDTASHTAAAASSEEGVNSDQALANALEVHRNGGIAIIRRALSDVKAWPKVMKEGGLREVGAEGMRRLVFPQFVRAYQEHLLPLLSRLHGGDAVRYILDLFRQLG